MPNTNISDVWPNMGTYFGFRQPQINRIEEEKVEIREAVRDIVRTNEFRRFYANFPGGPNSYLAKVAYQHRCLEAQGQLTPEALFLYKAKQEELLKIQRSFLPVDESLADVKEKLEKMRQESVAMENALEGMLAEFNKKKNELDMISNDNLNAPLQLEDINEQNLQPKLDAYNFQVNKGNIEIDFLKLQIVEDKFLLHQAEQNILEETYALDVIK